MKDTLCEALVTAQREIGSIVGELHAAYYVTPLTRTDRLMSLVRARHAAQRILRSIEEAESNLKAKIEETEQ